jgi:malate dehydrogenase (oxaloacetate-decarboxylating)
MAGVEAIPLCLGTRDAGEIVATLTSLEPGLGGVHLEDIAAPRCFEIERRLAAAAGVPVFHDDLHGTAVVVLAALVNALRLTGRALETASFLVNGAGAAGIAVARLLLHAGALDVVLCDRHGAICEGRPGMNPEKEAIALRTNRERVRGDLGEVLRGRDAFIGLSVPGVLTGGMVRDMAPRSIVFALASPAPEIVPDAARAAGAAVVGTGRADHPNQIHGVIAFPGMFRGALDVAARHINDAMSIAAAHALADLVPDYELSPVNIVPRALDFRGAPQVAAAVARAALQSGEARRRVDPRLILENTRDYLYGGTLAALEGAPIETPSRQPLKTP